MITTLFIKIRTLIAKLGNPGRSCIAWFDQWDRVKFRGIYFAHVIVVAVPVIRFASLIKMNCIWRVIVRLIESRNPTDRWCIFVSRRTNATHFPCFKGVFPFRRGDKLFSFLEYIDFGLVCFPFGKYNNTNRDNRSCCFYCKHVNSLNRCINLFLRAKLLVNRMLHRIIYRNI